MKLFRYPFERHKAFWKNGHWIWWTDIKLLKALTPEGPNLKCNPRGTNGVSNAIFVWRIQNRMIANFFVFHHNSRQKLTHVGFSISRKPRVVVSNESWLIFEKSRFMTHVWLTHIRYAYIMTQNFTAIFSPTKFFWIRPRKFSNIVFFLKCVGVIFFRPHIRIQNKILHQMIWIHMDLSVIRPRKDVSFEKVGSRPRNRLE